MKNLYLALLLCYCGGWAQSSGTEEYILEGNNSFNLGIGECESDDPAFPNLRFTLQGTQEGIIISDGSGEYALPLAEGVHILTPELENPEYFNISPSQITVTFPQDATPAVRNFCVNPNGVHHDIEVVVVPLSDAVAGQTATFALIYRNKGNQVQSGSLNLTYDPLVIAFASSDPAPEDQAAGYLSFNFDEITPFGANHILVNFTVTGQAGQELNLTANGLIAQDAHPNDNSYALTQNVLGSANSLQMICVEGETVGTSSIGSFVHYLVRFENLTDQPIQDLVITSEINPAHFDLESLVVIKGSHDFHSRITGNTLVFTLDDIGLPIGIENQGYILYRIRTSDNLVAGDTFSNSAMVQFDQQPPFTTNTFTTTIQSLSTASNAMVPHLRLVPNPGNSIVTLSLNPQLNFSELAFYNLLGQRVAIYQDPHHEAAIDISSLASGVYQVRLAGPAGDQWTRFVKN